MKTKLLIFLLVVTLIGCSHTLREEQPKGKSYKLWSHIDSLLSSEIFAYTQCAIHVFSITDNRTIYEHNGSFYVHPASTLKMIVAASAYAALSDTFNFYTKIFVDSSDIDRETVSVLYFKGYGNPLLLPSHIDSLASQLAGKGIKTITKGIMVDDSYFDSLSWGNGWMIDDIGTQDAPYISPLSINKNKLSIWIIPPSRLEQKPILSLEPYTRAYAIENLLQTVDIGLQRISINWKSYPDGMSFIVSGTLTTSSPVLVTTISVPHPEYFAADLLQQALTKYGIRCGATCVKAQTPRNVHQVACVSTSLDTIVATMLKKSDNLAAECVLKTIGAQYFGVPGTTTKGIAFCYRFLDSLGIDTTHLRMVDGSGISRYNLITSSFLTNFLTAVQKRPDLFQKIFSALPIAGVDGTLSARLQNSPATNLIRAKTGTLNGVSNIAGYVLTNDRELLAFAIMMQHFIGDPNIFRAIQDSILVSLTTMRQVYQ